MKAFRPARDHRGWFNFVKTVLQTALFWSIFLIAIPALILFCEKQLFIAGFSFVGQQNAAVILFAALSIIAIYSSFVMSVHGKGTPLPLDCAQHLVVRGPYAHVRNPMAITGLGQAIAVGIFFGSWLIILYTICGGLIWHFAVRPIEEADLQERFGDAYRDYCRSVRCWIPNIRPYHSHDQEK